MMLFLHCGVRSLLPASRPSRVDGLDASAGSSRDSDASRYKSRAAARSRLPATPHQRQRGAVNDDGVLCRHQWRHGTGLIPGVSLLYVSQKARETNTLPHTLQLMETALGARLSAGSQEDF